MADRTTAGAPSPLLEQFDRLLELPSAVRDRELQALRDQDPALARQLCAMLAADADPSGVLDRPAAALLATDAGADSAVATVYTDRSGSQIGEYRLLERIGIGGMGEVYRALRTHQDYAQEVALKLLRVGEAGGNAQARFTRERQILARLEHPGIARLIDGGVAAGTPWLAMELVRGETLIAYARSRGLDLHARLGLIEAIARAVDYAHRQLVVHRDLKPSNVVVDEQGQPRLLDFGIAKLLDDSDLDHLTATDARLMSPAYATPEQLQGAPITIATDVYALGLLLYELLVGELPHRRREVSLAQLAAQLQDHSVERPSARLRELRTSGGLPPRVLEGDLDTIVGKALAYEPERRYPSAAALAEDLERFRTGHPIRARADTFGYRLAKFVRRNRVVVVAATLALLGLCVGLGVALWQAREARAQTQRAETVKQFLISMFAEGEAVGRDKAQARTPLQIVEEAMAKARNQFAGDAQLADSVIGDLAEVQVNLGAGTAALPAIEAVIDFRRAHYGAWDVRLADALAVKLQVLFQLGRFPESEPLIEEAETIYRRAHGATHIDVVNMLNRMVRVRIAQTRYQDALTLMREVVRLGAAIDGPDAPGQAMRLSNLAVVLIRTRGPGDQTEARSLLEQSLQLLEHARGAEHATLLFPLNTLGDLLRDQGEEAAALSVYQRAAGLAERSLGTTHPRFATALNRLGDLQQRMGQLEAAERTLSQALAIQEQGQFAEVVDTYRRLGNLAQRRDDPDAAARWYDKAYARGMQTQGAGNLQNWLILQTLAEAQGERGDVAAARATLDRTEAGLHAVGEPGRIHLADLDVSRGLLDVGAGDTTGAIAHFRAAMEAFNALGKDDAHARTWLAAALLHRAGDGDRRRAMDLLATLVDLPAQKSPRLRACFHYAQARLAGGETERDTHLAAMDAALAQAGSSGRLLRPWRLASGGR